MATLFSIFQITQISHPMHTQYLRYDSHKDKKKQQQQPTINMQATQPENYLQTELPKPQFLQITADLLSSLNLLPTEPPSQIYQSLLQKNGKVQGKDVLETVQSIRSEREFQQAVRRELGVFRERMHELMKRGVKCVEVGEYRKGFPMDGVIAGELEKYVKDVEFVSLAKLAKVMDSVEDLVDRHLKVNTANLKVSGIAKSNIFDQEQFDSLPDIQVQFVLEYIAQQILDPGIQKNLSGMLKRIDHKLSDLTQSFQTLQQTQTDLRNALSQLDNELYTAYQQLDSKQAENDRLRKRIAQYEEEVGLLNKRYQDDVLGNLRVVEEENQRLCREMSLVTGKLEEVEIKLAWFKENYEGLTKEYEQFLRAKDQEESKENREKEERMFIQRTVKEQLEDAQGKISRLRIQNGELKTKNSDLVFSYQNKLTILEAKIKQLEDAKDSYRVGFLHNGGSKIRNSYLDRYSKIDDSSNYTIKNSKIPDTADQSVKNLQILQRSSVQIFQSIIAQAHKNTEEKEKEKLRLNGFKKNKEQISIRVASIMTVEDQEDERAKHEWKDKMDRTDSNLSDFSKMKFKDYLEDQEEESNKQKQKQKSKDKKGDINKSPKQKSPLTCQIHFLTPPNNRYPAHLILSQDRFTFLDTKMRPTSSIKFSQLRKIIFCHHNPTWMVLKVKPQQRNQRGQGIWDVVFCVLERRVLGEFLGMGAVRERLREAGVWVGVEKEDSVWITSSQSETLLSNFTNYYNLMRISITNSPNIFEATLKTPSIFSLETPCILIPTEIGLLAFQQDGDHFLERSQNLLHLIPIVELMEIQAKGEHRLVIRYPMDRRTVWKVKCRSAAMCRRLREVLEGLRREGMRRRVQEAGRLGL